MSTITSPRQPPPQPRDHPAPPASPVTNSARSSLSIDRSGGSQPPRRNRTALRDYYKLASTSTTNSTSTPTSSGDPLAPPRSPSSPPPFHQTHHLLRALDEPGFDAAAYVKELLRTASLEELLRVESALVGEIGGADGERKALVYDNYSKLIDATETIRRMRLKMDEGEEAERRNSNMFGGTAAVGSEEEIGRAGGINVRARVGPMIETIERLALRVASVDQDAAAAQKESVKSESAGNLDNEERSVNNTMGSNSNGTSRESNDVVNGTVQQRQSQQQTVRWILDTPRRLDELVKEGKRNEAEKDWERVAALLQKWEGVKGVQEVRQAAEAVIK